MRRPRSESEKERGRALAQQLVRLRTSVDGLSQSDVANRANVSIDLVRKIERATVVDPGFFTVAKLARVLDGSLDALATTAFEQAP